MGPTAVLAADQYCRRRGAMLIVDPPSDWASVDDAVDGVSRLGYASPNILAYFPRMRRAGSKAAVSYPVGAAIAGIVCKLDRQYGPWQDLDHDRLGIARTLRPALDLDDDDVDVLKRAGINAIMPGRASRARIRGGTTLGRGTEQQRVFASLPVRRTCLRVAGTIDLATRWSVFEPPDELLTRRIRAQISAYLYELADLGAFESDRFVVECDAGLSIRSDQPEHGITILIVIHPAAVSFTIHQTVAGCRVTGTAFGPVGEIFA